MPVSKKKAHGTGVATPAMREASVRPFFQDIMDTSVYAKVDPRSCFPLTAIRPVSMSGVRRLKAHLRGTLSTGETFGIGGMADGTDTAMVVAITGTLRTYLKEYFRRQDLSEEETAARILSVDQWYGIVDGIHTHAALLELMSDSGSWDGFKWRVTLLKGGFSLHRYRQLARIQNTRQDKAFNVEMTLYDRLNGLRVERDRLIAEGISKKPTAAEIASQFDGVQPGKDSTIKQAASTAARLPQTVIDTMGIIMNAEHPDVCMSVGALNRTGTKSTETIMELVDCRVFRKFISLSCLKSCTTFMNAKGADGEAAQVNTLFRLKDIYQQNGFKSFPFSTLAQQFQLSCDASSEDRKFMEFLDGDEWPALMKRTRENLMTTTRFDKDLLENRGNDRDIVPSLLLVYKTLFPTLSPMKEAKYNASNIEAEVVPEDIPPPRESTTVPSIAVDGGAIGGAASDKNATLPIEKATESNASNEGIENEGGSKEGMSASEEACPDTEGSSNQNAGTAANKNQTKNAESTTVSASGTYETALNGEEPAKKDEDDVIDDKLATLGINCYQMTWQTFSISMSGNGERRVDAIVTDPPGSSQNTNGKSGRGQSFVDNVEMEEFVQFCKRMLKTGGYVFMYTSIRYFSKWHDLFNDNEFQVMDYEYVMAKKHELLQKRTVTYFPQKNSEMALIARKAGQHPSGFLPDFDSSFHLIECPTPRRFSAIYNVPIATKKLMHPDSRSPVIVEEKSVATLTEIMDIFVQEGGTVLDAYAGTLTTALACLQSNRQCISIEQDATCFKLAMSRLREYSRAVQLPDDAEKNIHASEETETADITTTTSLTELTDDCNSKIDQAERHTETVVENATKKSSLRDVSDSGGIRRSKRRKVDIKAGSEMAKSEVAHLTKGSEVEMLIGELSIGTARLHEANDGSNDFVRRLHNTDLCSLEVEGQHLVVITKIEVFKGREQDKFPYHCPGADTPPNCLGDLYKSGFYPWDSKKLQLKV